MLTECLTCAEDLRLGERYPASYSPVECFEHGFLHQRQLPHYT